MRVLQICPGHQGWQMSRRRCLRMQPTGRDRRALRVIAGVMLLIGAALLGGCAASSGSGVAGADPAAAPAYAADGSLTSGTSASAFAPTGPAVHSASASQAADSLTAVAKPGSAAYKIGPLDMLDVSVFKVPDLNKEVQVAEDGTINYPLIGDVPAAGKTPQDLERELTKKLGAKYLKNPQVTVTVKEFNSQRVTVSGAVKTSGVYSIKGSTSLMQLVAMAGDIDMNTDSGDVVIFRNVNGQRSAARFDLDAIRAGKAADPQVEPGDVVVVDSSATKVAFHNIISALPIATTAAVFSGL